MDNYPKGTWGCVWPANPEIVKPLLNACSDLSYNHHGSIKLKQQLIEIDALSIHTAGREKSEGEHLANSGTQSEALGACENWIPPREAVYL